jgi:hypothetical protein
MSMSWDVAMVHGKKWGMKKNRKGKKVKIKT